MPTTSASEPVVQVRPGLWSVELPLPMAPHVVIVYVLETEAGPYLIDAGWDTNESLHALRARLARIGTRVEDIRGVLVTHAHLDHYGLAPRIREISGAWVSLHSLDAAELTSYRRDPADRLVDVLRAAGAPDAAISAAAAGRGRSPGHTGVGAGPDVLMEDGDRPKVPGWDLTALWTPGHTPGHLCFWSPRYEVLLVGDHVLPRTVVAVHEPHGPRDDPLGAYLTSLDRLEALAPGEILPAHEYRFTDLSGRLTEVRGRHRALVASALRILGDGPATAWQVAERLARRGTLEGLSGFPLHAVVTRALMLLGRLRHLGLAEEVPGSPPHWRRAPLAGPGPGT
ncbi:MBL fold metallo-hydrolase [Streptomyces sp. NPDC088747]|uniref:MBL fold metallo-hydrolase n=1 Tax=Streptomyces sp. NPDC088747 TaxID=3365886 RepID=UPI00380079ED